MQTANTEKVRRRIVRLDRSAREDAVRVLAEAFHDYPVMKFVLADADDTWERKLKALMRYFCERRLTTGWPLFGCVSPDGAGGSHEEAWPLVAVAGVNDPGPFVENDAHREAWRTLSDELGRECIDRLVYYERESDGDAPHGMYHFLGIIGVLPERQGDGHARALIEHIIARSTAHPESTGVWLSTERAENVPFYQHLGFHVHAERDIGGLCYRVMVRNNPT